MADRISSGPCRVGVVVIGRNEGERLVRCLESAAQSCAAIVYVDSGSSDGSPKRARELGARVVDLDTRVPFTAARGRNAGLRALEADHPDLELVQFVDGDCELAPGWLEQAAIALDADPKLAVVCGRRRERHPDVTLYNRLTDIEWDTPVGPAHACGGDAMMRIRVLRTVGAFDPTLIAGEEPELCLRIRRAGFGIARLDAEMTAHDAALDRFAAWWRRQVRSGHAYAELVALHGPQAEPAWTRGLGSALVWGLGLPTAALGLAFATRGASLALLLGYAVLIRRIERSCGLAPPHARLFARFCAIGKLAQARGALEFAWNRGIRRRRGRLIEYKGPSGSGSAES